MNIDELVINVRVAADSVDATMEAVKGDESLESVFLELEDDHV